MAGLDAGYLPGVNGLKPHVPFFISVDLQFIYCGCGTLLQFNTLEMTDLPSCPLWLRLNKEVIQNAAVFSDHRHIGGGLLE